jgi:flagellar biosynthesis GTPase FlhF
MTRYCSPLSRFVGKCPPVASQNWCPYLDFKVLHLYATATRSTKFRNQNKTRFQAPGDALPSPWKRAKLKVMTTEERFERIESNLLAMTEANRAMTEANRAAAEEQAAWQKDFRKAMDGLVESHALQQKSLATLTASITAYVDESNARVKRLEENLDALIRAITSEHSNGKTPH